MARSKEELIDLIKKDEVLQEIIFNTFLPVNPATIEGVQKRDEHKKLLSTKIYERSNKYKAELYELVKKEFENE